MDVAVVNYLIYNILSVLETEASLLWGVHEAVDDIKDELISMQSFLVDADKKREGSEGEKTWVANVRDMADEVEDVIDKFMYHINSQRIGGRSTRLLHHTIYFPQNLWVRYQTATKIQKINRKIKGIPERNQRYDIDHVGESTSSKDNSKWVVQHAESSLFFKEDELVGIEKKRKLLMGWLMDGELHQTVISIVGMGGSGKTTLVANTYNNDSVKRHFECYAWITVSQAYVIEDLLKSLIKEFYESRKEVHPTDLSSKNYRELIEILVYYLQNKRYLLVLDDVWETRPLNQIKVSLPDSCLKSRIILTTRNENVACFPFGVESHVYHIQELQTEEAWELFCKKAFSSSSNRCPLELESFAWKLVEKCEGLPLAIAALGSLMYSKNKSQWNKIDKSLDWRLSKNPELDIVERILLLSFNDLPHQLKHCFLYCSLFPEDYMIRRRRLMKLWIAEGFVEQVQGSTLEEVAESYLGELIFRSMLQVVWRNEFERPKACKMHDVMREIALAISERQRFCVVHDGGETTKECKARCMSIHKIDRELESFTGISKLRSFLVFNRMLKILPSEGKMLRVLDLQNAQIDGLSDELFNLFNLRYLNLRGTLVKEIPKSIGRLLNLQTLDIKNTQIKALPREIGKLQNLRHLIVHHYTKKWNDLNYVIGA